MKILKAYKILWVGGDNSTTALPVISITTITTTIITSGKVEQVTTNACSNIEELRRQSGVCVFIPVRVVTGTTTTSSCGLRGCCRVRIYRTNSSRHAITTLLY